MVYSPQLVSVVLMKRTSDRTSQNREQSSLLVVELSVGDGDDDVVEVVGMVEGLSDVAFDSFSLLDSVYSRESPNSF